MLVKRKCLHCGKEFYTHHWRINIGKGKFCCKNCYHIFSKGKHLSPQTEFKKGQKSYVSPEKRKYGKEHWNWKGGRYKSERGYILIIAPNHPNKTKQGYIRQHRLIVEQIIGRYLNKIEVVHHINGILDDNRPENLYLFNSHSEHEKFHKKSYQLISNII